MIYSRVIRNDETKFVLKEEVQKDDIVICEGDMITDLIQIGDLIGSEGYGIIVDDIKTDETDGLKGFYGNIIAVLEFDVDVIMTPTTDGFKRMWSAQK